MAGFGPGGTDYEDKKIIEKLDVRATFKLLEQAGLKQRTRQIRNRLLAISAAMLLINTFDITLSLSSLPLIESADDGTTFAILALYHSYLALIYIFRYRVDVTTALVFDFSAAVRTANKIHLDHFMNDICRKAAHEFKDRYSLHKDVKENAEYQHIFDDSLHVSFHNALYKVLEERNVLPSETTNVRKFEYDRRESTRLTRYLQQTLSEHFKNKKLDYSLAALLDGIQHTSYKLIQNSLNSNLQEQYKSIDDALFEKIRTRISFERKVFDFLLPFGAAFWAFCTFSLPRVIEMIK